MDYPLQFWSNPYNRCLHRKSSFTNITQLQCNLLAAEPNQFFNTFVKRWKRLTYLIWTDIWIMIKSTTHRVCLNIIQSTAKQTAPSVATDMRATAYNHVNCKTHYCIVSGSINHDAETDISSTAYNSMLMQNSLLCSEWNHQSLCCNWYPLYCTVPC